MKTITYENIKVKGFEFKRILSVQISHRPNQHGAAVVEGEAESDKARDLVKRVDETTLVNITTDAEGQPEKLFSGYVKDVTLKQENEYSIVTVRLNTTSILLDVEKKNKSFQDLEANYKTIIQKSIKKGKKYKTGDVDITVSDKTIDHLIMQYEETTWEFALRMASQLKAPVVADIASPKPKITIGIPTQSSAKKINSKEYTYTSNIEDYERFADAMTEDFSSDRAESYEYAYIGDKITINDKDKIIKGVDAILIDGILRMHYDLMHAGGSVIGLAAPRTFSRAAGRMINGIVRGVKKDKVKVSLKGIGEKEPASEEIDENKNWVFPFSTVYSSSDGSGWYCMPEKGDHVRIFFPTGNEEDAFAASAMFAHPPKNPENKVWKAPGGKEILLTDEGMYIIGKSGKIYINLTDEKGVEIYSDKEINVMSDTKVNISAGKEVHIAAKNEIIIGTENAYIDLDKSSAVLTAKKVLVN